MNKLCHARVCHILKVFIFWESFVEDFFHQEECQILLLDKLVQLSQNKNEGILEGKTLVLYVCISLKTELRRKIYWNSS